MPKKTLKYEVSLGASETPEGRVEMVRMLRVNANAMLAMADELESKIVLDRIAKVLS